MPANLSTGSHLVSTSTILKIGLSGEIRHQDEWVCGERNSPSMSKCEPRVEATNTVVTSFAMVCWPLV
jgi:hypothetical protein